MAKNWLDKYNAAEAENGIEGTMDGLTDQGFNYNGAWGGTMAMGGSLPGATGHFYARYEGGGSMPGDLDFSYPRTKNIPSKGPYAKKTLASAQTGEDIKQVELPPVWVIGSKDPDTEKFYQNFYDNLVDRIGFEYGVDADEFKKYINDDPEYANKIMGEYQGMMNLGNKYGFPEVKPFAKTGLYKNAAASYDHFNEIIYANHPITWKSEMAHHVQSKDNKLEKSLQWLSNDAVNYLQRKNPYETPGTLEYEAHSIIEPGLDKEIEKTKQEYINKYKKNKNGGITSAQNGREMQYYQEGLDWKPKTISRDGSVTENKTPVNLPEVVITPDNFKNGGSMSEYSIPQAKGGTSLTQEEQQIIQDRKNRIKASIAARENGNYTKDNWRQQLADESQAMGDKFRLFPDDPNSIIDEFFNPGVKIGNMASNLGSAALRAKQEDSYLPYITAVGEPLLQGIFEGFGVKSNKQFFKNIVNPFNVPGKKYIKKVLGKTAVGKAANKVSNKITNSTKNFKKDFIQGYKGVPTKEDGGIIDDPNGQWAYPGEITRIPSNQITMQGVDYPVLGISDTGDTQMMYPNQEYSYDGESVTEYPMMKQGGWLNKYN